MRPIKSFWLLLLPLLGVFPLSAQSSNADLLDAYYATFLPEKVFVHTDKAIYAGGETIYAAVYLLNGLSHQPDSLSKTIYLELLDSKGELFDRKLLFAADGHTAGRIDLPAELMPGDYQIAAYTNYQRNSYSGSLFRKTLRIVGGLKESGGAGNDELLTQSGESTNAPPLTDPSVELKFFPESGDCTTAFPCRVAIVSQLPDGAPVAFQGSLLSPTGQVLQPVSTKSTGIGTFTYTPTNGEFEIAAATNGRTFRLPRSLDGGSHIRVDIAPDTVDITVSKGDPVNGLRGYTFLLHLRGAGLFEQLFTSADPTFVVRLPVALLPAGVIVGTLLDPRGNAVAERLFFIPPKDCDIAISTDRERYPIRAPVEVGLDAPLGDLPDSLNVSRLSMSVLPLASTGGPPADDIRSWVLLNSDIDRPIQQAPELICGTGSWEERELRIDHFLLTRAWRRFRWEALPKLSDYRPDYPLEQGLYLRGRMTKLNDEEAARPGKIFLTRVANAFADETLTDEEGYFTLGPYFTLDTFPVTLQGRFKSGKKNRLNPDISLEDKQAAQLKLIPYEGPEWSFTQDAQPAAPPQTDTLTEELVDYAEISRQTLTVARNFDSLIIDLATIDVSASRIDAVQEAREKRTRGLYKAPNRRVEMKDFAFAQTTPLLGGAIEKLPGVRRLRNSDGQNFFNIRDARSGDQTPLEALLFLDGQPTRLTVIQNLPMRNVEFIDIVSGPQAVGLGTDAAAGAILIYQYNDGRPLGNQQGVLETTLAGYHTVREFATFDASLPANRNRPDLRTTLHWEPLLRTGPDGKVKATFQTSDQLGQFLIFVQGLREDGTPLYGEGSFEVE